MRGEANLSANYTGREGGFRGLRLQDTAGIEVPGVSGCSQISATRVDCVDEGLRQIEIATGDRDDRVQFASEADPQSPPVEHLLQVRIDAGGGNDRVGHRNESPGGATYDLLISAGTGNDTVNAGWGVGVDPGDWNSVDVDAVVRLGAGGDTARVTGPFTVHGQAGNDRLVGGLGGQRLLGGAGRDRLLGGKGTNDVCDGGAATDKLDTSCEEILNP